MKHIPYLLLATALLLPSTEASAQENPQRWTLQDCLSYALEHNIQLKKSKVNLLAGQEDTQQAKAQLFPSLTASLTQGLVNYPSNDAAANHTTYNGGYNLNASWTLFDGNRRSNSIKQQDLQDQANQLSVQQNQKDIRISLLQTYMQLLYAYEAVTINDNTVEVSKAQRDRAEELLQAGSISRVTFAQMESQYSTDRYQAVVARKNLDNYKLQLKQLLELDITQDIEIAIPELTQDDVMATLPPKETIYTTALTVTPDIKSSELNITIAQIETRKAAAAYYPTLSLTAGISTGHASGGNINLTNQVWDRLNENLGLTLSIPILNNRSNKTALNKAHFSVTTSQLDLQNTQKALLQTVEGIYLDATSAQNQYIASSERLKYVNQSYQLTEEQFFLGMKNTLELLTEKNNLLNAQQEELQSKYMAILSIQLLNIYQDIPLNKNY